MKYTSDWLKRKIIDGTQIKYLFFWGHKPALNGEISETCFSQWWTGSEFTENGIIYKTAEHYMMAKKAELFQDDEFLEKIIKSKTPGEAKKYGRQVRNFNQETWENERCKIVISGNILKFDQNSVLKEYLIKSNDRIIVEASPRDRIWGIGLGKANSKCLDPNQWRGKNLLGFCLMEVRDKLK